MSKRTALHKSPDRAWGERRLDRSLSKRDETTGKYCCAFHRSIAQKTKASDGNGLQTAYKTLAFDQLESVRSYNDDVSEIS
jgi:hypothetical protein